MPGQGFCQDKIYPEHLANILGKLDRGLDFAVIAEGSTEVER
jgi:hypothetical protein